MKTNRLIIFPLIVIPRLPALQAPWAMISYVDSDRLCRHQFASRMIVDKTNIEDLANEYRCTVSLAGYYHGTCKNYSSLSLSYSLALLQHHFLGDSLEKTTKLTRMNFRVTRHTPAVFSSSRSISLPTTLSSLPRSTSQLASTTPTSTRMAASAWTFSEISGALR